MIQSQIIQLEQANSTLKAQRELVATTAGS